MPESEMSKPKRQRPGVDQQRKVILAAAIELFAEKGSAAVSVSEISRKAGVSRDTYYRCFPDKASLLTALYDETVNQHMHAVMAQPSLDYSDQHWLHQVCSDTIDAILARHNVARFLFVEAADPTSPAAVVIQAAYEHVAIRMQSWYLDKHGACPQLSYFKALIVAVQWLLHDAINQGLTQQAIDSAKQSAEQLLFVALNNKP